MKVSHGQIVRRSPGYSVPGGYVKTARCTVCGGIYTKGEYSEHVKQRHVGRLYSRSRR
jgi:hypothetical protein